MMQLFVILESADKDALQTSHKRLEYIYIIFLFHIVALFSL